MGSERAKRRYSREVGKEAWEATILYVSNASAIASGDFFCGENEATDTITVYISKDERRGWK